MSPWPGTPKSQQTPAINPPSQRNFPSLHEESTMADVAKAVNTAFDGLTVHEQAFANIPKQIAAQASAAATAAVENITNETVTGVTSFNSLTGAILYFPGLGYVNNELGNPNYTPVQGDAGKKIIMGDSSPVTVTLNASVTAPWFAFIGNDSSATVALSTDSSATIAGIHSVYPGGTAIVFFDGTTFWCEGVVIAADSSLGVVKPDGVTIGIDSSGILSYIGSPIPNFKDSEVVAGSGTSWTLAHTPAAGCVPLIVVQIPAFGGVTLLLSQTPGFTISGAAVTTTSSYSAGALFAWYRY